MNKAIKAGSDAQATDATAQSAGATPAIAAPTGVKQFRDLVENLSAQADAARPNEPAFTPPQANPAVPRDEHHGKGGVFALIDGKRVPVDADGQPIPPRAQ